MDKTHKKEVRIAWLIRMSQKRRVLVKSAYHCHYCGRHLRIRTMTIDHQQPLSRHGADDESNMVAACLKCNRIKADRSYETYMAMIEDKRRKRCQKAS